MNTKNKRRFTAFGAALFALTVTAFGQNTTWTNVPDGGAWTDPANWDNGVPSANSAYLTNTTASYTVTFNGPSPNVTNLIIANTAPNLTTLEINSGCLSSSNGLRYDFSPYATSLGSGTRLNVNINGQFYNYGAMYIGSNAVLQINGGSLTNKGLTLMGKGSTLIVNSGKLSLDYVPYVGYPSSSTQEAVMVVNGGYVYARAAGASYFNIGMVGAGRLVISNGVMYHQATGAGDYLNVGYGHSDYAGYPGTGFIDMYGGVFTNEVPLYLGRHLKANTSVGDGRVLVAGGSMVQGNDMLLGFSTNDYGRITITNTGSLRMTAGNSVFVGRYGSGGVYVAGGELIITNTAMNATIYLGGSNAPAWGRMFIAGGTTTVNRLWISPWAATGTLEVSAGRLDVRDFSCTNGSGNPQVTFQMNGAMNGTVAVTNAAALAGTLTLVLTNRPATNTTYQLFSWGSLPTGSFGTTNIQGLTGRYRLDCGALYTDGTVTLYPPPKGTIFIGR